MVFRINSGVVYDTYPKIKNKQNSQMTTFIYFPKIFITFDFEGIFLTNLASKSNPLEFP